LSDEVASDSEDEKRIRAADNRAVRKSSPSGRMVKLIERDRQKQQEHLHSLFIMVEFFLILRSPFVQSELWRK
jgi:hypothetical protein